MRRSVYWLCAATTLIGGCTENGAAPTDSPVARATAATPAPGVSASAATPSASASSGSARPDPEQRVVATIDNEPITLQRLLGPLMESHGLTVLLNLVQLELARQDARRAGVTVTEADFQKERADTLNKMFVSSGGKLQEQLDTAELKKNTAEVARLRAEMDREHETLLDQFLSQQHISRPEFDLILRLNATLRKIVEPKIAKSITEDSLRNAFGQLYGEKVKVRHIQLANPLQIQAAQRRLAKGDRFEDVARDMSMNRMSGELGGELPAFSRQAQNYPQNFKDVAFSLKKGQVSDIVEANSSYHLIKLEEKIEPQAVTFESQRENVRRELTSRAIVAAVKALREDIAVRALAGLKIQDPVLAGQFDAQVKARAQADAEKAKVSQQADLERARQATRPARFSGDSADVGTPGASPAGTRPPATEPARGAATQPAAGPASAPAAP